MNTNQSERNYVFGVVAFGLLLLAFSDIKVPFFQNKVEHLRVTLQADPKYGYTSYKGNRSYWIKFFFYETPNQLQIREPEYRYTNHPKIIGDIRKDSQVDVEVRGNSIIQLTKKGFKYIDPDAAAHHVNQNHLIGRIVLISGLITCLIPLIIRYSISRDVFLKVNKNYGWILVIVLILSGVIANYIVGGLYWDRDWTKYPIPKVQ